MPELSLGQVFIDPYKKAVEGGYSGTEQQFYSDLASVGNVMRKLSSGSFLIPGTTATLDIPSGASFLALIPIDSQDSKVLINILEIAGSKEITWGDNIFYINRTSSSTLTVSSQSSQPRDVFSQYEFYSGAM